MPEEEKLATANGSRPENGENKGEDDAPETFGKEVGIIVPPPDIKDGGVHSEAWQAVRERDHQQERTQQAVPVCLHLHAVRYDRQSYTVQTD
eukprot:336068-Amorphochlora_amoeboformis.AAC.1